MEMADVSMFYVGLLQVLFVECIEWLVPSLPFVCEVARIVHVIRLLRNCIVVQVENSCLIQSI